MRSVFIWCFFQWVGEQAEGEDSGSKDCDYDFHCVVEWWGWGGKHSLEWICACGGEQKQCRVDIMQVIFVLLFLLFFIFMSTMLLMGQYEENLGKDTNSNSTKNITNYTIEW